MRRKIAGCVAAPTFFFTAMSISFASSRCQEFSAAPPPANGVVSSVLAAHSRNSLMSSLDRWRTTGTPGHLSRRTPSNPKYDGVTSRLNTG